MSYLGVEQQLLGGRTLEDDDIVRRSKFVRACVVCEHVRQHFGEHMGLPFGDMFAVITTGHLVLRRNEPIEAQNVCEKMRFTSSARKACLVLGAHVQVLDQNHGCIHQRDGHVYLNISERRSTLNTTRKLLQ